MIDVGIENKRRRTMRQAKRDGITKWYIASGLALLFYIFSVGWATRFVYKSDAAGYEGSIGFSDGALIIFTGYYPYRLYVPAPQLEISTYWEHLGIKIFPRFISPSGFREATVPLWIFALPIWLATFLNWRRCKRRIVGICAKCRYNHHGLNEATRHCPECGCAVAKTPPEQLE